MGNTLQVLSHYRQDAFPLVNGNEAASIVIDSADATVVSIAAEAFQHDVNLITDKMPEITTKINSKYTVIAGTIGTNKIIDDLIQSKKINVSAVKNKWECFTIQLINKTKLVIAGSDRRGTAFGIFHLSKLMGVSPLVYWADVVPQKKSQLFISGTYTSNEPSVKYR